LAVGGPQILLAAKHGDFGHGMELGHREGSVWPVSRWKKIRSLQVAATGSASFVRTYGARLASQIWIAVEADRGDDPLFPLQDIEIVPEAVDRHAFQFGNGEYLQIL
jgi:hypothetical protein